MPCNNCMKCNGFNGCWSGYERSPHLQIETVLTFVGPGLKACQTLGDKTAKTLIISHQNFCKKVNAMQRHHSLYISLPRKDIIMTEIVIMACTESSQPGSSVSLFSMPLSQAMSVLPSSYPVVITDGSSVKQKAE